MDGTFFVEVCEHDGSPSDVLVLPFADRQRARQRVTLRSGREVGLKLPRGTVLRGGDCIRSERGMVVQVLAADEAVSTVRAEGSVSLARAAYHLGNRHIWVQVGDGWLRYLADHVIDDMVRGLGAQVVSEWAPFEPEAGAYSHGKHAHGPDHGHHHHEEQHDGHAGHGG